MSIQKTDPYLVSPSSWNNLNNKKWDVNSLQMYNKPLKYNSSFKLNKNLFKSNESNESAESDESDGFNLSYEFNEPDDYYDYNEDDTIISMSPILNCVKNLYCYLTK
tara:strand:+ start:392 stop:712 length:321 start_codon:yes stop_codon:yes gene_type:complete